MKFDFAFTNNPVETVSMYLNSIYNVDADTSYCVNKNIPADNKELILIRTINGSGVILFKNNKKIVLNRNDLYIFEYSKVVRYYCEKSRWNFWWVNFNTTSSYLFPLYNVFQTKITEEETSSLHDCLDMLKKETNSSKAVASASFLSLLYKWMYLVHYEKNNLIEHHDNITTLIRYLHSNIHLNIHVSEMAKMSNLSERRFRDIFVEITGKQPKVYYDNMKMSVASELLKSTSLSIAKISEDLGFKNQFYFNRVFKRHYKMNPSEYRAK